jgi:hypothetical protein
VPSHWIWEDFLHTDSLGWKTLSLVFVNDIADHWLLQDTTSLPQLSFVSKPAPSVHTWSEIATLSWNARAHAMTWFQVIRCASSDCDFFISSEGVLTRTPACNAAACSGWLLLDQKNIVELGTGVFSNMSGITTLWVLQHELLYIWVYKKKPKNILGFCPPKKTKCAILPDEVCRSIQNTSEQEFLKNWMCHLSNDSVLTYKECLCLLQGSLNEWPVWASSQLVQRHDIPSSIVRNASLPRLWKCDQTDRLNFLPL